MALSSARWITTTQSLSACPCIFMTTRLVFSARRSEHITPLLRPSLAACSKACQIQVICVGLLVSARYGTVVRCRRRPVDFCCWHPPSLPVCQPSDSGGQIYQMLNARQPRISCGSCACLEQPPIICQGCAIISVLLELLEDMVFELTLA